MSIVVHARKRQLVKKIKCVLPHVLQLFCLEFLTVSLVIRCLVDGDHSACLDE